MSAFGTDFGFRPSSHEATEAGPACMSLIVLVGTIKPGKGAQAPLGRLFGKVRTLARDSQVSNVQNSVSMGSEKSLKSATSKTLRVMNLGLLNQMHHNENCYEPGASCM